MPIDTTHELRIDPPSIAMDVDLAAAPPTAALHVVSVGDDGSETDVTATATYAFTGPQLGAVTAGQLASDGLTGGAATLAVTFHELSATIDVTANVHGKRIVDSAAADAFAAATAMPAALQLAPGDGVVLPPNLGELDLAWTADPAADTHRVHITAPYLDVEVDAPGPSAITLAPNEWQAVARTARGGAVNVDIASLQSSAPAIAQVQTATYRIGDIEASTHPVRCDRRYRFSGARAIRDEDRDDARAVLGSGRRLRRVSRLDLGRRNPDRGRRALRRRAVAPACCSMQRTGRSSRPPTRRPTCHGTRRRSIRAVR